MAKKRKLNSNNPKYKVTTKDDSPVVKEKKLMCNAAIRNASGEIVPGKTVAVYGVWCEDDE